MIPAVAALAMLAVLLYFMGHHNEQATVDRWDMTLNPEGLALYSQVADGISETRWRERTTFDKARESYLRGESDTVRLLDLGSRVIGDCSRGLVHLLSEMGTMARLAEAIAPHQPLVPRGFNAGSLKTLAGIHHVLHHLMVTTRERLGLRLAFLRFGVRESARLSVRAAQRLIVAPQDGPRWFRLDQMRGDMGTLTDESLDTLRLVLASLAAVKRPAGTAARRMV